MKKEYIIYIFGILLIGIVFFYILNKNYEDFTTKRMNSEKVSKDMNNLKNKSNSEINQAINGTKVTSVKKVKKAITEKKTTVKSLYLTIA